MNYLVGSRERDRKRLIRDDDRGDVSVSLDAEGCAERGLPSVVAARQALTAAYRIEVRFQARIHSSHLCLNVRGQSSF